MCLLLCRPIRRRLFLRPTFPNEATHKPIMASSLFFHPAAGTAHRTLALSTKATPPQNQSFTQTPEQENKYFAVATGELFLGITARILKRNGNSFNGGEGGGVPPEMFVRDQNEREWWWRRRLSRRWCGSKGRKSWRRSGSARRLLALGCIKETTPLAGSSAGAIVCTVIASGASMDEAMKATKMLAEDCRLRGTAFRLEAVLRDVMDQFLPDDAHIRSNGRVRVGVTEILWRPRGLLVDQFDSNEDLINAVFTSSFIPGYLAPRPATMFRNRLCIDGGLTLFMPPTSAAQTVRVCAFPAGRLGLKGIGISPDCNPENRATARELFNWALEPAADEVLDRLFELGYLDAAVWAKENPVEETVREESADHETSSTEK